MKKPDFGYHRRKIKKGKNGEFSKIEEELMEFKDALEQNNPVMALVELSDLIGSIELWLEKHHPTININDLVEMKNATKRSFLIGHRKSKG